MQLSIQNNKTAFKANIRIIPNNSAYENIPMKAGHYIGMPWIIQKSVKILDEGFTDDMAICTAGYIQNGKIGILFHLNPGRKENTKKTISRAFANLIKKLKDGQDDRGNLSAFITGGKFDSDGSQRLHRLIKNILERNKIPFSSVWGHKGSVPLTDLFVSAVGQEYIVNANLRGGVSPRSIDDLKKVYNEVIIRPEDTLSFS